MPSWQTIVLVLSLSSLWRPATAMTGDVACVPHFCVSARVSDDNSTVTYQMEGLDTVGWMAIGFGKKMWDTPMVILWPNANGSTTLSQRYTKTRTEPKLNENPPFKAVLTPDFPRFNQMQFPKLSFDTPALSETFQTVIWAMSNMRPETDDIDSPIHRHVRTGIFDLDLTKPIVPASAIEPPPANSRTDRSTVILAHGFFLSVGFLVLLPCGALVARWGRTFFASWFRYHQMFNLYLGAPVITFGWLLGPLAVIDDGAEHLSDSHKICGVILFAMYIAQLLLGRWAHAGRSANVTAGIYHPRKNVLHASLGVSIIVLSFYQVRSGLHEWHHVTGVHPSPTLMGWLSFWTLLLPALYLSGLFLLSRQFGQEKHGKSRNDSEYLPLDTEGFIG